ncbi:MAG: M48 family metallopeptidase [Rhodospirillales bacterium]|nr:M48 family metallopeptidase [Alphaproteobacteria bacterium]MBL6948328.1 M48 family metallopeptidase [Rhodospirillales bacterium]
MTKALSREASVDLAGRRVAVRFLRNRRARRIILRLDTNNDGNQDGAEDGVVVTLPGRTGVEEGLALVRDKADWVLARLEGRPPRIPFVDGAVVPLGGVDHVIRHTGAGRGLVRLEGANILVAGGLEHTARRVRDWFRGEAKARIRGKVRDKAAVLDRTPGRITVRDTKSRWGSCSHDGNLSFCWRLVMAPESVLDYVVAHEVAHLAEHNHGPEFWRLVGTLTDDMDWGRDWLRRNGERLHRIG